MAYVAYVCAFVSSWTVVAFTIERYIVVFYPLKKTTLCRCVLAFGGYCFSTWIVTLGDKQACVALPQYEKSWRSIAGIDTILTFILPSFVIFLLNVAITIKIREILCVRKSMTSIKTMPLSNKSQRSNYDFHEIAVLEDNKCHSCECRGEAHTIPNLSCSRHNSKSKLLKTQGSHQRERHEQDNPDNSSTQTYLHKSAFSDKDNKNSVSGVHRFRPLNTDKTSLL